MELTTLYKQYRAAKLAADQAAKEEDKLKKALKKAMRNKGGVSGEWLLCE